MQNRPKSGTTTKRSCYFFGTGGRWLKIPQIPPPETAHPASWSSSALSIGTAALVPANGNASAVLSGVTAEQLGGPGTHNVIACFSGDGANDAPSANFTTVTVEK